jgi:hypothetical protein
MKIQDIPIAAIDWSSIPALVQNGETGTAVCRTQDLGDVRIRLVRYSAGYKADHSCNKGHIIHVLDGSLVIEHEDETRTVLGPCTSWHAPDEQGSPHRVICESGADVFIVD